MSRHIVDVDSLHRCESPPRCCLGCDVLHDAQLFVVLCPPGEVVEARGVVGHLSIPETNLRKVLAESIEGALVLLVTHGECHDCFHKRGAVESVQIDDEVFGVPQFQGMCHIGKSQEFLAEVEDGVLGATLMPCHIQKFHHQRAV